MLFRSVLGVSDDRVVFPFRAIDSAVAREVAARDGGTPFALLNPGAAWPNKRWPPVYFGEVAAGLAKRHGLRSIVSWGPGEKELANTVVAASHDSAVVSPGTTLGELVALAREAAVMVSGDTGPIHVAGAVGTPLVGIYGPTNPDRNGKLHRT